MHSYKVTFKNFETNDGNVVDVNDTVSFIAEDLQNAIDTAHNLLGVAAHIKSLFPDVDGPVNFTYLVKNLYTGESFVVEGQYLDDSE